MLWIIYNIIKLNIIKKFKKVYILNLKYYNFKLNYFIFKKLTIT